MAYGGFINGRRRGTREEFRKYQIQPEYGDEQADDVVVVFFTLTDRASTIPNNTRGCQSGTWSAGQKKIRGTSTKLQ